MNKTTDTKVHSRSGEALTHYHRRESDINAVRNKLLMVAGGFVLWWLGTIWQDYREQGNIVHRQEIELAEVKRDIQTIKDTVANNAQMSSDERALILERVEKVDNKIDSLQSALN